MSCETCDCCNIQVGNIGTVFRLTIKDCDGTAVNVSAASAKQIVFKTPSGVVKTRTASFTTDGTDGKIQYATAGSDLDEAGVWRMQALVTIGGGTFYSSVVEFTVKANL